ncbi:hypothetical protein ASC97_23900 [Rhizobium sp. Root1203]|jgi:hypothetical protein|nr:hypothetical protein ASC97_23900 [Rhizobium sp. Root1203]
MGLVSISICQKRAANVVQASLPYKKLDTLRSAPGGKVPNAWFGRDESKELMFFAGIHVPQWTRVITGVAVFGCSIRYRLPSLRVVSFKGY